MSRRLHETSEGARNASEIVVLTCRMLHFSRAAICSGDGARQQSGVVRQARAQDARASDTIGRAYEYFFLHYVRNGTV